MRALPDIHQDPFDRLLIVHSLLEDMPILSGDSEEKRRSRLKEVPLGRIADPLEIAEVVLFLLTEGSSYITGADIDVNGGLYIH